MSWLNTVAVAIRAPLEVDITAASAAASTRPASSGCSCISTSWAKASSRDSSAGSSTFADIPITAPATAYSRQYTPAAVPAQRATPGLRAVNTRCQMSWPISSPKP